MRALAVAAIVAVAIFLGFAFGQWSLNPGEWDEITRGICGLFMSLASVGAAGLSRLLSPLMDEDD